MSGLHLPKCHTGSEVYACLTLAPSGNRKQKNMFEKNLERKILKKLREIFQMQVDYTQSVKIKAPCSFQA